ncbi:MAG: hypothetical protein ABI891_03720 [Acidobacteriota bacterium]
MIIFSQFMQSLGYDAIVGENFMCKKFVVFSLAFCLGFISIQLAKQNNETSQKSTTSVLAVENSPQTESAKPSKPISDFIINFQDAVARNDKETVVSFIKFPIKVKLNVNDKKHFEEVIKNENELLSNYDKIFDNSLKTSISEIKPENFFVDTGCEVFFLQIGIRIKMFGVNDILDISKTKNLDLKIINLDGKY